MRKEMELTLKITAAIQEKRKEMFELLEKLVNQDSHTIDKKGVDLVGQLIHQWLEDHDYQVQVNKQEQYGNQLIATVKGDLPGKIMIMMHMDTVFPNGTAHHRPFTFDELRMYGPGVADMKSGIVSALYATWIAHNLLESRHCEIELLFTSDEEIASPCSRLLIEKRVIHADAVFNMEPARADGSVVTGRRGSAQLKLSVVGKAAHSGLAIEEGINAISELCRKLLEFEKLADKEKDVTVNLGKINGGVSTNMVAPHAEAFIHFGFWKNEDFEQMYSRAKRITDDAYIDGTKAELTLLSNCLPMVKNTGNASMYDLVTQAAQALHLPITEQSTRGAADAGIPSSLRIPTICGMGPVGGHLHSEEEYVEIESFYERTALLAYSIILASKRFSQSDLNTDQEEEEIQR